MITIVVLFLAQSTAHAYSSGKTNSYATGCTSCHGSTASATTGAAFSVTTITAEPGEVLDIEFTVSSSDSSRTHAGLNVGSSDGTFAAGSNTKLSSNQITHNSATAMSGGAITFNLHWTAPTAEGTYTLKGAGNAVNNNGAYSGDGWALATDLTVTVDDGCNDADGDGYEDCDDDCDDDDAGVNPGADEDCDGADNNCNGEIDEDATSIYYNDGDGDGYGDESMSAEACEPAAGYVAISGDCDDDDAYAFPGAEELCDEVDNDCDGAVDDDVVVVTWYADADGDSYGDAASAVSDCAAPDGHVDNAADCDDTNGAINPESEETWYDGTDQDCDGNDDDQDGDGAAQADDCDDTDASLQTGCDSATPDDTGGDSGGDSGGGDSGGGADDTGEDDKDEGCGCDAGATPASLLAVGLAGLAARRRRRAVVV